MCFFYETCAHFYFRDVYFDLISCTQELIIVKFNDKTIKSNEFDGKKHTRPIHQHFYSDVIIFIFKNDLNHIDCVFVCDRVNSLCISYNLHSVRESFVTRKFPLSIYTTTYAIKTILTEIFCINNRYQRYLFANRKIPLLFAGP